MFIKLTKEEFIEKANAVHIEEKFDYSLIEYQDTHTKIKIICPVGHVFEQTPAAHLQKQGCRYCHQKNDLLYLTQKIEEKNFKLVEYKDCRNIFIENKYGILKVRASDIRDSDCNFSIKCAINKTEYFINKSKEIHGNRYDYSKTVYIEKRQKVIITCSVHGDFNQNPSHHLAGSSCRKCHYTINGYGKTKFFNSCKRNSNGLGILYVVRCFNENEEFYKIGITGRTIRQRFSGKTLPYKYEIIQEIKDVPEIIYNLENDLTKLYRDFKYKPRISFKGETECYKF